MGKKNLKRVTCIYTYTQTHEQEKKIHMIKYSDTHISLE